jgi:microtubule-associated protein, RP/EB family
MSNIGIMDGAFFVGRKEILEWLNSTLKLNLTKIEQTAFGGVACQLLDIMHPGQVPVHKINWSAKQSFEFVANYNILQTSFKKLKIEKYIDVEKLIKGKYMDNLEFMQWFKRFFEMTVSDIPEDYDAVAQRMRGKGGASFTKEFSYKGAVGGSASVASTKRTTQRTNSAPSLVQKENNKNPPKDSQKVKPVTTQKVKGDTSAAESQALKAQNEVLGRNITELKQEMDGLEKERDFYFDKLRDIEMMLQDMEDNGNSNEMSKSIFKILYATAEGFEATDEDVATAALVEEKKAIIGQAEPEPAAIIEEN